MVSPAAPRETSLRTTTAASTFEADLVLVLYLNAALSLSICCLFRIESCRVVLSLGAKPFGQTHQQNIPCQWYRQIATASIHPHYYNVTQAFHCLSCREWILPLLESGFYHYQITHFTTHCTMTKEHIYHCQKPHSTITKLHNVPLPDNTFNHYQRTHFIITRQHI
jgi:hypothetical protein